jgi:hypothetical protein
MELPNILTYGASWVTITGGIWLLFERAESAMSPKGKLAVSQWLRNLDAEASIATWATLFGRMFDSVFGERHLSWRCFWRSSIASFLATGMLLILWAMLRPAEWGKLYHSESFVKIIGLWALGTAFLNIPADYFSLLKSRSIIRVMSSTRSVGWVSVLLALDVIVTVGIFIGSSTLLLAITSLTGSRVPLRDVPAAELHFLRDAVFLARPLDLPPGVAAGIWFYSAFFTSIWVWLYAASGGAVKLAHYVGRGVTSLRLFLDIEDKPIRSIGVMSMGLVTAVYVLLLVIGGWQRTVQFFR